MKSAPNGGMTTIAVKENNVRSILLLLKENKGATAKSLSEETGLSSVTVNTILKELIKAGWITKGELSPSTGGRPSREYCFNYLHKLGLLIYTREINGIDSLCLRLTDLDGQVQKGCDYPATEGITISMINNRIVEFIHGVSNVSGIAMGIPGIEHEGTIVALDYQDLVGYPVVQRLSEQYSVPVIIENDVNAAVMGYRKNLPAEETVVYIYFPRKYPPGAGICMNGKLVKGQRHFAGEVGWLPLETSWGPALTDNKEVFIDTASKVVVSLSAVLDPDRFVLFGEHIQLDVVKAIRGAAHSRLPDRISPLIEISTDFNTDFENGLSILLIEELLKEL